MVMRSEKEIRAKLKELDDIKEGTDKDAIMAGIMMGTLLWVLKEDGE